MTCLKIVGGGRGHVYAYGEDMPPTVLSETDHYGVFGAAMKLDVVIIGDTLDAWAAADEAARLGCRTAVLRPDFDGQGTATGAASVTAAFRESAADVAQSPLMSPRELWNDAVRRHERSASEFCREFGVRSWRGPVRLTGANSAEVFVEGVARSVAASLFVVAVGTAPRRPKGIPFDRRGIFVPEEVPHLTSAPRSLVVLGGNRTARAFGRLFARAGSNVVVIDSPSNDETSPSCDLHFGEVIELRREANEVKVRLSTGDEFSADALLFAADRVGATASLALSAAGIEVDETGRLWCDANGNTWLPSIAAVGDVVGFPKRLCDKADAARTIISSHFGQSSTRRVERSSERPSLSRVNSPRLSEEVLSYGKPSLRIFSGPS